MIAGCANWIRIWSTRWAFGFGILGKVSQDSRFFMSRGEVTPGQWKTQQMLVQIDGNILLMKSVSRQEDSLHSGFQAVPTQMSVAQGSGAAGVNFLLIAGMGTSDKPNQVEITARRSASELG